MDKYEKEAQARSMSRLRGIAHAKYLRERLGLPGKPLPEEIFGREVLRSEALSLYSALSKAGGSQAHLQGEPSTLDQAEVAYIEFCMNLYERLGVLTRAKKEMDGGRDARNIAIKDGLLSYTDCANSVAEERVYEEKLVPSIEIIGVWLSDNKILRRLESFPGIKDGQWEVVWPERKTNYTNELCNELQKWRDKGLGVPSAMQILEVWSSDPPIGIDEASFEGFELTNTQGSKIVKYRTLQKAISLHVRRPSEDAAT